MTAEASQPGSAPPPSAAAAVVVRGSLINLVAMVAGAVMSFGLVVLVSRWLQPGRAGVFFELIALFTILSNTFELGADTGLTRWISRARVIGGLADVRRMVAIAVVPVTVIGTGAAVAVWLAAPQLARLFLHGVSPAAGAADIRIIAPLVPLGALSACVVDGVRGFGRMWPYLAIEGVGKPALRIALVAGVLFAGLGSYVAIAAWGAPVIIGLALGSVIFARVIRKEVPAGLRGRRSRTPAPDAGAEAGRPDREPAAGQEKRLSAGHLQSAARPERAMPPQWERPQFPAIPELDATVELPVVFDPVSPVAAVTAYDRAADRDEADRRRGRHRGSPLLVDDRTWKLAGEFWAFTGPRAFQATFQVVILWLDILIVGALTSDYQAGIYSAVSKLAIVGTFALEGNRLAIGPQLSAMLARRQHDRAAELYQSATRWLMLASWPLYLVFAVFPATVLGIFGARYQSGAEALAVLSLAMLVNLGTGNVTVVLLMGGKSSWSALNAGAALIVNIGLNLLLVPRIGILGAALAWAASIVVDNVTAMIEIRWVMGLAPFGPGYGLAAAATVGCFGGACDVARFLFGQTLAGLAAAVGAGLLAYAVVLYFSRGPLQLSALAAAVRPPSQRTVASTARQRAA